MAIPEHHHGSNALGQMPIFLLLLAITATFCLAPTTKQLRNFPSTWIGSCIKWCCSSFNVDLALSIPSIVIFTVAAVITVVSFHAMRALLLRPYNTEYEKARLKPQQALPRTASWIYKTKDKFLMSNAGEALHTILNIDYEIIGLLCKFKLRDVFWSIVALSRLQHVMESHAEYSSAKNDVTVDKHVLEELAHYCTFANAAYGIRGFGAFAGRLPKGGNIQVLVRSTGIDECDIVATNWRSELYRPAYYIARDHHRKAIVLSICGLSSCPDAITFLSHSSENFIVDRGPDDSDSKSPPVTCRGHKGMVKGAKSIARMTATTITNEANGHPDYSLVIVGHSLGGGVASILAAIWSRRFHKNQVRAIGYGTLPPFPLDVNSRFDNIITVEVRGDPASSWTIGHIADWTIAIAELSQDEGLRDELLVRAHELLSHPKNTTLEDYKWFVNVMTSLRKQVQTEKNFPPGKVYQLSGSLSQVGGDSTTMIKPVDSTTTFDAWKICPRMFDIPLHLPIRYEVLLERLAPSKQGKE